MVLDPGVPGQPQRPIRLLSLDGGGIRGLSSILILKEIMRQVNQGVEPDKHLQPWQFFDLVGGTSTGGIIAIMLGLLRMTIDECHKAYVNLSKKIFRPKRGKYNGLMRILDAVNIKEKFESKVFEETIREIIKQQTGNEQYPLKVRGEASSPCKVFVTTVLEQNSKPMLLRSYDIEDHSDLLSDGFPLWGACRATSAATSYFEPFAHGNLRFVDGAFANNNPVFQVMIEAEAMWKDRQMMLVSIGTGNAAGKSLDGGAYSLLRTLPKLVTQTENTADQFYDSHQDMVDRDQYFRFTVDGLGVVGLGDYKMVNAIESETLHYLRQGPIGRRLKKCMESLLDRSPKAPPATIISTKESSTTFQETECLRALHRAAGDYESQRIGIDKAAPGTCQWISDHEKFRNWISEDSSSLLWITAGPGCGKSVLSSYLVDYLTDRGNFVVSSFFKAGGSNSEESYQALCGMLHQICLKDPSSASTVTGHFGPRDETSFVKDVEKRWDDIVSSSELGPRFCIIDALDECRETSRDRLISCLLRTFSQEKAPNNGQLKVIVTSRPWPEIEERFVTLPQIRLRGEDDTDALSNDVKCMIRCRVEQLQTSSSLTPEACALVEKTLIQRSDSTFLWAHLVLETISRLHSRKLSNIKRVLDELPQELDQLYEQALQTCESPEESRRLLGLILAATRPLSLHEFNIAFNISASTDSRQRLEEDLEPNIEYTIKRFGAFFVRIAQKTVLLVHETARNFLLKTTNATNTGKWRYSIDLLACNLELARACMRYLLLEAWSMPTRSPRTLEGYRIWMDAFLSTVPAPEHSFHQYASANWASLLESAEELSEESDLHMINQLCDITTMEFDAWWYSYIDLTFFDRPYVLQPNTACMGQYHSHFAARKGDLIILKGLLAKSYQVSNLNARGLDILAMAAFGKSLAVTRWLLETFEHHLMQCGTAMIIAISRCSQEHITSFLKSGVDVNGQYLSPLLEGENLRLEYPLTAAVPSAKKMKFLIENGAVVVGEAMVRAAKKGAVEEMQLLVEQDTRTLEERLPSLQVALQTATEAGDFDMREYLLRVCPGIGDTSDLEAGLAGAINSGDRDNFRKLLQLGVRDTSADAIKRAAVFEDLEGIEILFQYCSYLPEQLTAALAEMLDVKFMSCYESHIIHRIRAVLGRRPLIVGFHQLFRLPPTSNEGHTEAIVSGLLERGAVMERHRLDRAVTCFIANGHLSTNFWVDQMRRFPDPPFVLQDTFVQACLWGRESLVCYILDQERNLDINLPNTCGVTPLLAAVISGRLDLVTTLLERGADPSVVGEFSLGPDLPPKTTDGDQIAIEQRCCQDFVQCYELKDQSARWDAATRQWYVIIQAFGWSLPASPILMAETLGVDDICAVLREKRHADLIEHELVQDEARIIRHD